MKKIDKIPKPEVIMRTFILAFCENAAELGCPKDKEVDMWFRYLSPKQQVSVCKKIIKIMDKFYKNNS